MPFLPYCALRPTCLVPPRVSYRLHGALTYENGPPRRLVRIVPPSRFHSRPDGRGRRGRGGRGDVYGGRARQQNRSPLSLCSFFSFRLFPSSLPSFLPSLLRRPDKTSHKSGVMRHQRRPEKLRGKKDGGRDADADVCFKPANDDIALQDLYHLVKVKISTKGRAG